MLTNANQLRSYTGRLGFNFCLLEVFGLHVANSFPEDVTSAPASQTSQPKLRKQSQGGVLKLPGAAARLSETGDKRL